MPTHVQRDDNRRGGRVSSGVTVLTTLQERLDMYQQAHSNAVSVGDSSKARRLHRGLQASLLCTRGSRCLPITPRCSLSLYLCCQTVCIVCGLVFSVLIAS